MTYLKYLRLSRDLTQEELSEASEVKRWRIALGENGHFCLSDGELARIADVFEVKAGDLLRSVVSVTADMQLGSAP